MDSTYKHVLQSMQHCTLECPFDALDAAAALVPDLVFLFLAAGLLLVGERFFGEDVGELALEGEPFFVGEVLLPGL